jgi:polyhydroxyalkanoate synthase subunit PhaC
MIRNGPKPLHVHMGMASLAALGLAGGQVFDEKTLQQYFKGIQKYQTHGFQREPQTLTPVWQAGQARLLAPVSDLSKYKGKATCPIVLIPSMVNTSDILDLLPDKSFLRWIAAHGLEVYLFDWGKPIEDDGQASFAAALKTRLIPALQSLGRPVTTSGYCMGGLFSIAAAALSPASIKSLGLLATPWNFHDQKGYLKNRLSVMAPVLMPYLKQHNRLPDLWMNGIFATLDPQGTIQKFASFADMKDSAKESLFVAVEDWLNDGVDLSADIATTCVIDWYGENKPFLGTWDLDGHVIQAQAIAQPALVITGQDDRVVPPESALGYAAQRDGVGNLLTQTLVCPTGHLGLMAGNRAKEMVWKPVVDWCAAQQ